MQIDIFNFLFGNILFVQKVDIYLLAGTLIIGSILWIVLGKKLLRTILCPDIARSQ